MIILFVPLNNKEVQLLWTNIAEAMRKTPIHFLGLMLACKEPPGNT